jgi:DNA-binding transcriptional LysR family regulator
MEADTFDLIVNLVTMGMGLSIVPYRALPIFPKTRAIQRIALKPRFSREVVVVVRKDRKPPEHLTQFIDCILFGRI